MNSLSLGLLLDLALGVPGLDLELDGLDKLELEFEAFIILLMVKLKK